MQLGIFAKIFDRPNVSSCLQDVAVAGIPATQFNLSVAGLPTIPDEPVPDDVVDAIRASANQAGVALAAISGTFNAAHPDPAHRQTYLARSPHLCVVARASDRHRRGDPAAPATLASSDVPASPTPTAVQPNSNRSAPGPPSRPVPANSSPPAHPPAWPTPIDITAGTNPPTGRSRAPRRRRPPRRSNSTPEPPRAGAGVTPGVEPSRPRL